MEVTLWQCWTPPGPGRSAYLVIASTSRYEVERAKAPGDIITAQQIVLLIPSGPTP